MLSSACILPSWVQRSKETRCPNVCHSDKGTSSLVRMRRIVFSFFFFRRLQPALFFFLINLIETKVLRASSTSEFSHSLDPERTSERRLACGFTPCARGEKN